MQQIIAVTLVDQAGSTHKHRRVANIGEEESELQYCFSELDMEITKWQRKEQKRR